jgi:hypothetical protein
LKMLTLFAQRLRCPHTSLFFQLQSKSRLDSSTCGPRGDSQMYESCNTPCRLSISRQWQISS